MKILVSGAAGFIGSHLAEHFVNEGHEVHGIDTLANGSIDNVPEGVNFDVYEDNGIYPTSENNYDYIFHEAALGSVPRSFADPGRVLANNINATGNALELARKCKAKIILASSSSVVANKSPYSSSKVITEELARLYREQLGVETVCLRYFNVFGARQKLDLEYGAVIPRWIDAAKKNEPIYIHGLGTQRRDFTYIRDVVRANVEAMKEGVTGTYDVGSSTPIRIFDAARMVIELTKSKSKIIHTPRREGCVDMSCATNNLVMPMYGFRYGLEEMLGCG